MEASVQPHASAASTPEKDTHTTFSEQESRCAKGWSDVLDRK